MVSLRGPDAGGISMEVPFLRPFKSADKKVLTPAQRLGITDKQFDWKDIIYFK